MNYRHDFHAGNFADLIKHAALTLILDAVTAGGDAVTVVDTHGGAGIYDLSSVPAQRSGEGQAAARLMADPAAPLAFDGLKAAVRAVNVGGDGPLYPGSPLIAARRLRKGDGLTTCELQADARAMLAQSLAPYRAAQVLEADGYETLARLPLKGAVLVLIDPPFERPDDYQRAAAALDHVLTVNPSAQVMIWLPLKDLETFDSFLRRIETDAPLMVAQVRLQPLTNPMKMNGCALVIANPPPSLSAPLAQAAAWIAAACGGDGASSLVETLT